MLEVVNNLSEFNHSSSAKFRLASVPASESIVNFHDEVSSQGVSFYGLKTENASGDKSN